MEHLWQYSAPANLLLAGEYSITLPDGHGLALAVHPRARATATAAQRFTVVARAGATPTELDPAADPLVGAVLTELGLTIAELPPVRLEIDTAAFFDTATGAKLGLGSSAAATLLLTAAIERAGGGDPIRHRDETIRRAIRAHRGAHGGRGSGYDIAASGTGGAIRFVGGESPSWTPSRLDRCLREQELTVHGWVGPVPVHSADAVARFQQYVPRGSTKQHSILERNNRIVDAIEEARTWRELFRAFSDGKKLGEEIGEQIGVSAALSLCSPHVDDGWVVKASGAGNERAVIVATPAPRRPVPRQSRPLSVAPEGLREEEAATPDLRRVDQPQSESATRA